MHCTVLHNCFNPLPLLQLPGEPPVGSYNIPSTKVLSRSQKKALVENPETQIKKNLIYLLVTQGRAETEIRRERGSIAPRKDFARPESFCAEHTFVYFHPELVWKITKVSGNFLDCLESFQIVLNVFELSESFRFWQEISVTQGRAETEIRRERKSIAPRKDFARPESFCAEHTFVYFHLELVWKITKVSGKFLDCLERFQIVLNVFELSESFRFWQEIFRVLWKIQKTQKASIFSGKLSIFLESFQNVCKIFRLSAKFLYCLESFQIFYSFSIMSGKFPACLETFQIVYKLYRLSGKFCDCLYLFQIV